MAQASARTIKFLNTSIRVLDNRWFQRAWKLGVFAGLWALACYRLDAPAPRDVFNYLVPDIRITFNEAVRQKIHNHALGDEEACALMRDIEKRVQKAQNRTAQRSFVICP